jgi:hypothetical protein
MKTLRNPGLCWLAPLLHAHQRYVSQRPEAFLAFFADWLLGPYDTGADILELQNQKQANPSNKFKE